MIKKLHLYGIFRRLCFFLINSVFVGTGRMNCAAKRRLLNGIGCSVGEGTTIVGPIDCRGTLIVGKNCWIGKNFKVNGNGTVVIGDNCDIGPEVTFQTGGHEIGTPDRRAGAGLTFHQTVGSGTWIGGRATILNNVTIGKSCVVAGCACVVCDMEKNSIWGGVPARLIRRLPDEADVNP